MVLYLILGAITIVAIAVLVVIWVQLDRRITGAESPTIAGLAERLEAAESELKHLCHRVEDLETIATAESLSVDSE